MHTCWHMHSYNDYSPSIHFLAKQRVGFFDNYVFAGLKKRLKIYRFYDMWQFPALQVCFMCYLFWQMQHSHFFGLEHEQTDRMYILTLCSLESLMLSEISFTGKWWHTIKVIAICYVAHLGQLEETYYVLSVFCGHSDTVPQGLAISLTMNSSNSH